MEIATSLNKNEKYENFVKHIIDLYKRDKKAEVDLKKGDNKNLSYKSWQHLIKFNIDIENDKDRIVYGLIATNIVKNKLDKDGKDSIGIALSKCYENKNQDNKDDNQGEVKLMRLLACDSYYELCQVLKYYLPFIEEKAKGILSYSILLKDILYFNEKTKAKWASDFFKKAKKEGDNDTNAD